MRHATLLAGLLLASVVADAASIRLDDSASPKTRFDLKSNWQHEGEEISDDASLNALVARAEAVEIRLNTTSLIGKRGRIYLGLPLNVPGTASPDAIRMQWTSRGRFLSGTVLPGSRTLLYDGLIDSPMTRDVIDISIILDARKTFDGLRVETYFEFDPAP